MNFDKELDADLKSGQVLKALAAEPGAVKDFQTFPRQTGHELLSHGEANKEFTFFMRKKRVAQ
jgi:tRNA 2-thiouridine synthesizing protein A